MQGSFNELGDWAVEGRVTPGGPGGDKLGANRADVKRAIHHTLFWHLAFKDSGVYLDVVLGGLCFVIQSCASVQCREGQQVTWQSVGEKANGSQRFERRKRAAVEMVTRDACDCFEVVVCTTRSCVSTLVAVQLADVFFPLAPWSRFPADLNMGQRIGSGRRGLETVPTPGREPKSVLTPNPRRRNVLRRGLLDPERDDITCGMGISISCAAVRCCSRSVAMTGIGLDDDDDDDDDVFVWIVLLWSGVRRGLETTTTSCMQQHEIACNK